MKKLLIIIFLIIPCLVSAGQMSMNPAKFKVDSEKNLKGGAEYNLTPDFYFYSGFEEDTTFQISVNCLANIEEICCNPEWFTFTPTTFILSKDTGQKIQATIKLPRDVEFGNYKCMVMGRPIITANSEGDVATTLGVGIASILEFRIQGKLSWWRVALNWLNKHIFNRAKASLSNIGIGTNAILILCSLGFLGLLGQKVYTKIKKK